MGLSMTLAEREEFLAGLHVGVIGIEQPDTSPLAVPIWYGYEPAVGVWGITSTDSVKGRLRESDRERDSRPMAHRYFGKELGDLSVSGQEEGGNSVYTMQPERWRTVDYSKLQG